MTSDSSSSSNNSSGRDEDDITSTDTGPSGTPTTEATEATEATTDARKKRLEEFRAKTKKQEEALAAQPRSTIDNPFPDHKALSQDELKKYSTKPDPKSLRQRPQGGCDY